MAAGTHTNARAVREAEQPAAAEILREIRQRFRRLRSWRSCRQRRTVCRSEQPGGRSDAQQLRHGRRGGEILRRLRCRSGTASAEILATVPGRFDGETRHNPPHRQRKFFPLGTVERSYFPQKVEISSFQNSKNEKKGNGTKKGNIKGLAPKRSGKNRKKPQIWRRNDARAVRSCGGFGADHRHTVTARGRGQQLRAEILAKIRQRLRLRRSWRPCLRSCGSSPAPIREQIRGAHRLPIRQPGGRSDARQLSGRGCEEPKNGSN